MEGQRAISFKALAIGYRSGGTERILLPELVTFAGKGELVAVIGENGIGKSTLLRTVCGLQDPISGHVLLSGRQLKEYSRNELARIIGYISTEPVRVSNMTVFDLVSLGRYPHTSWTGRLGQEDIKITFEAIERVGLKSLSYRYINELSDGERQRAMIARVLAQDADVLVMDEPTAFLDIRSKYEIIHLLHNLTRYKGKTIIFSTHDLNIALNEADKIWLAGRDTFTEGSPEDLILAGSFSSLFDSSLISFSDRDASFSFRREQKGRVIVKGQGIIKIWTERAVNRAGFNIVGKDADFIVSASGSPGEYVWILSGEGNRYVFHNLYDLARWLGTAAGHLEDN